MSNQSKSELISHQDAEHIEMDNIYDSVTNDANESEEEIKKQIIINYFKQKFEYFSKHVGAYTAITTLFFAIITAAGKFFRYVFEAGRVQYLEIPKSSISIFNENLAYDIALAVVIGCIMTSILVAPYFIFKYKGKRINKSILIIIDFWAYSIVFAILTEVFLYIKEYNAFQILAYVILLIIMYAVTSILPSALFFIFTNPEKNSRRVRSGKLFLIFYSLFCIAVLVLYVFGCGWTVEKEKTKYRVVFEQAEDDSLDNTEEERRKSYVIIYENDNLYYLAESEIAGNSINSINLEHQKTMSKDNVEYFWMIKK